MSTLLTLDVSISENRNEAENDIRKLIPQLRSSWKPEDIKFKESPKTSEAGLINLMITCYSAPDCSDGIVFRIYQPGGTCLEPFFNRKTEIKHTKLVHDLYGFAPNVLAKFKNGFCYDYVVGEVMTPKTIREPETNWRLIAKQFGILNATKIDNEMEESKVYHFFTNMLDTYTDDLHYESPEEKEKLQKLLPTKDYAMSEQKILLDRLEELNCDRVFCHNDGRGENMVWKRDSGEIIFLDWECSGICYRAYEIAFHFSTFAGIEGDDFSLYPSKEFQLQWLRVYLETYFGIIDSKHVVTDKEVERLFTQVNVHYLYFLLRNSCWLVLRPELKDFPFNMVNVSISNFEEYKRKRDEILALKV